LAITADVSTSDFTDILADALPERHFDVGIAEQCMIDVAAGFALEGHIPYVNAFAVFLSSRALEAVMTHAGLGGLAIKLMATYAGISPQMEGPSHHAISDIAVMRSIPGMRVISPADANAMASLLPVTAEVPGPVYFRFPREALPVVYQKPPQLTVGRANVLRQGDALTIIGHGSMVWRCIEAAELLEREGIQARVIDCHTLKPIDHQAIQDAANETNALVTVEEHSVIGGLGGAVAEVLGGMRRRPPLKMVGLADCYAESGTYLDMLDRFGMSIGDIVAAAKAALNQREF